MSATLETDAFIESLNDDWDYEFAALTSHAKKLERERDKARDWVFRLRKHRAIARNFGNQMERERNHWKRECLEQAKLLAMSADREEKLRAKEAKP
jgi:hypothetical protein